MTYVIAEPCIGTKDTACVDACPVDCIHPKKDAPAHAEEEMLYIDPGGVHRLRRLRAGVPSVGHLRARRSPGKVEVVHRAQREVFRAIVAQTSGVGRRTSGEIPSLGSRDSNRES